VNTFLAHNARLIRPFDPREYFRFPIEEAFRRSLYTFPDRLSEANKTQSVSKLPTDVLGVIMSLLSTRDVLSLLSVSNNLRTKLLDIIDGAAKQALDSYLPWMLAKGEETSEWEKEVAEPSDPGKGFPWFVYRWACEERSTSMWNRRRTWRILRQIEEAHGVLC
jgi:hypothetical protein